MDAQKETRLHIGDLKTLSMIVKFGWENGAVRSPNFAFNLVSVSRKLDAMLREAMVAEGAPNPTGAPTVPGPGDAVVEPATPVGVTP